MNNLTIGIPKALLYYKYGRLWKTFFEDLGFNVIISPDTTKEILDNGIKYSIDEACTAMKIYMGHVHYLLDKCDYILVPRIECVKKDEKVCTNFLALYDLVRNTFDKPIIHYNVDLDKGITEWKAFKKMGLELNCRRKTILRAYIAAKEEEKKRNQKKFIEQTNTINKSSKTKILVAGHPYNLYDEYVGDQIKNVLESNNIEMLFSDIYDSNDPKATTSNISPNNYWTYNKEIISSIAYYEDKVDGIILITAFPCGPDSLSNEMIIRNIKTPIMNLIIDEGNSDTGLLTRIESFVDILEERKKKYGKRENN